MMDGIPVIWAVLWCVKNRENQLFCSFFLLSSSVSVIQGNLASQGGVVEGLKRGWGWED